MLRLHRRHRANSSCGDLDSGIHRLPRQGTDYQNEQYLGHQAGADQPNDANVRHQHVLVSRCVGQKSERGVLQI